MKENKKLAMIEKKKKSFCWNKDQSFSTKVYGFDESKFNH